MPVRKSLLDMYQTGREITFYEWEPVLDPETGVPELDDDGQPKLVAIAESTCWVAKLTKLDHRAALRRADAAKAEVLISARDRDSQNWKAALAVIEETTGNDRNLIVEFLIAEELQKRQEAIGAEVEGEDDPDGEPSEWKKDNYLQGLFDRWHGFNGEEGLKARYAQNPEDAEAKRVFSEMSRFLAAVDERLTEERAVIATEYVGVDLDTLIAKLVEQHLESSANQVWWDEWTACRIWLGTRKAEKHSEYLLTSRALVDQMAEEMQRDIIAALEAMEVNVTEGKGLPATRTSSP